MYTQGILPGLWWEPETAAADGAAPSSTSSNVLIHNMTLLAACMGQLAASKLLATGGAGTGAGSGPGVAGHVQLLLSQASALLASLQWPGSGAGQPVGCEALRATVLVAGCAAQLVAGLAVGPEADVVLKRCVM